MEWGEIWVWREVCILKLVSMEIISQTSCEALSAFQFRLLFVLVMKMSLTPNLSSHTPWVTLNKCRSREGEGKVWSEYRILGIFFGNSHWRLFLEIPGNYCFYTSLATTLKVESFAGRNFRDFANFSVVHESLYPRNCSFQVVRECLYPGNFLKFLEN